VADRDIHCKECGFYLGTIRDAKLHKSIVHLCVNCYGVPEEELPQSSQDSNATVDYLMNMFRMGGKR